MPERYLARLGIHARPTDTSPETLAALQYAHLTHIPYETLDIIRRVPFTLDIRDMYEKVVLRGRGGYCFELNGLFAWLLRALGFTVTEYFGRFLRDAGEGIPMRRHRVLRVRASDGRDYICDVGVGGVCPLRPLHFERFAPQSGRNGCWRLVTRPFYGHVIEELKGGQWREYYAFTEEPQADIDFVAVDYFCQHSPDSFFRDRLIVALQTETGRRTVSGDEFRLFDGDRVETITVGSTGERDRLLDEWFGIRT